VAPAEARPAAEARYDRLRRVLIVDDEPSVLRSLRRRLGSEYQVTTAESARQALELVSGDDTFDVILCDLLMPDMSGIDLYDAVRTFRPALGDRMVFMSGGAFTAQGHRFLADGTHLCVDKPLDPEALEQAMVKLAARTGRSGSE
jgi:CheY-like chemotaxis protein